ncbi:MAG: hypothetical protein IJR99_08235 [Kiritimatiellae bacterium]|nr:hypothetical protein [Kiritimatiellia bacterium]
MQDMDFTVKGFMRMIRRMALCGCVCIGLSASGVTRNWSAADGFVDVATNWNGNIPPTQGSGSTAGDTAYFTGSGNKTVRFPSGGWTDTGIYYFAKDIAAGNTLTFDATGTWWLLGPGTYPAYWQIFTMCGGPSGVSYPHILEVRFNSESPTTSYPVFKLTDGIVRLTPDINNGSVLELARGTWDFYEAGGTATERNILNCFAAAASRAQDKIILRDGTTLKGGTISLSPGANMADSLFLVEGGSHFLRTVNIGAGSSANPSRMRIEGGTVAVGSAVQVGNRTSARVNELILTGTGTLLATNLHVGTSARSTGTFSMDGDTTLEVRQLSVGYGSGSYGGTGTVTIAGQACASVSGNLQLGGYASVSDGYGKLTLTDDAVVTVGGYVWPGNGKGNAYGEVIVGGNAELLATSTSDSNGGIQIATSGGTGKLTVAENGRVVTAARVTVSHNPSGSGELTLSGNGELTTTSDAGFILGRSKDTHATVRIRDNARLVCSGNCLSSDVGLSTSGNWRFGNNNAAEARLFLEGGEISFPQGIFYVGGTNSIVRFDGGETTFHQWNLTGEPQNGITDPAWILPTNTLYITAGEHRVTGYNGQNTSVSIGNTNGNICVEMSGGRVIANSCVRLGVGKTMSGSGAPDAGTDHPAVFRMRGGTFTINQRNNSATGDSKFICSLSGEVSSVLEFTGGEIAALCLRGGSGTATLLADGGTFTVFGAVSGTAALERFTRAILGTNGLTVAVQQGVTAETKQTFTDADGVQGLFTKTGAGTLLVSATSSHAKTIVSEGTLTGSLATLTYGREVTLASGATLDLSGTATTLAADSLTLGTGGVKPAVIRLDTGDVLDVSQNGGFSIHGKAALLLTDSSTAGTYPVLRVAGTLAAGALDNLSVANETAARGYAFTTAEENGVTVVSLTISEQAVTDNTWTGTAGSVWDETDFTQPPTAYQRYSFPGDATSFSVSVPNETAVQQITLAGNYTFSGGSFRLPTGIGATAGTSTVNTPLHLSGASADFGIAASADVTLGAAVSGTGVSAVKTGGGRLHLTAASPLYDGAWTLSGGLLEFTDPLAFGTTENVRPLTITAGTLRYAGNTAATLERAISVRTGSNEGRVILDTANDLTVCGAYSSVGGLIKRGDGTLVLDLPAGSHTLGSGTENQSDGVIWSLEDTVYDPPSASTGNQAGLQILNGTLRVQGEGRSATTVAQTQRTNIGTGYAGQLAETRLEIADCTYTQGGPLRALCVGYNAATSAPKHPALSLTNSTFWCNTVDLGSTSAGNAIYPTLEVIDSSMELQYALNIGVAKDTVHPRVVIGRNAEVYQYRASGSTLGITFARDVDVTVTDGGILRAERNGSGGKGMQITSGAWGTVRVTNGGVLQTTHFTSENTGATEEKHLDFIFDGGKLEMRGGGTTTFAVPACQGFTTQGNGMEVYIGGSIHHAFATPFRGTGTVTKTGAGILALAAVSDNGDVFRQTGDTILAEGAIDLGGTTAGFAAIRGTGVISNGTLSAHSRLAVTLDGTESGVLRFGSDLSLPANLTVRIESPNGEDGYQAYRESGEEIPVAVLAGCDTPDVSGWIPKLDSTRCTAFFTVENSVIYATVIGIHGLILQVR